jgi:ribosomal protein L11 methyltransferase
MQWRRFSLRVGASDQEAASSLLSSATGSAAAITEVFGRSEASRARARPLQVSAYVPLAAARVAMGAVGVSLARARREGLLHGARLTSGTVRDEDWATSWKRFYEPSRLAPGLWMAPSWHAGFRPPHGARLIRLDPGMAFGTGQHPTTLMALRSLLPYAAHGGVMLDIGCGSGILGIAAAQVGARVYACDFDPIAVAATRENFRRNDLRPAVVKRATGMPAGFPRARLIAANITADVLAPLAPYFARKLAPGGALITSGVTKRGRKDVLDAFARAGLRLLKTRASGEWLAFVHMKKGG